MGNKRFWILDFGFWIEELKNRSQSSSKIHASDGEWEMGNLGSSVVEAWGMANWALGIGNLLFVVCDYKNY